MLPVAFVSAHERVNELARQLGDAARAMRPEAAPSSTSIATRALAFHRGDAKGALSSTLDAIGALSEARAQAQLAWTTADAMFEKARAACEEATVELEELQL